MSHLRALLTERTDDSHAAAVQHSRRNPTFIGCAVGCQTLVRCFGLYRIKPHAPLVVCLPANSFEFQPCGRTSQAARLTHELHHTFRINYKDAISEHRLQLGLPGSLIRFAPLAFVSQCQLFSRNPPSPLMFLTVSTHFTTPPSIPISLKITPVK